jgi:hypothetical protein
VEISFSIFGIARNPCRIQTRTLFLELSDATNRADGLTALSDTRFFRVDINPLAAIRSKRAPNSIIFAFKNLADWEDY